MVSEVPQMDGGSIDIQKNYAIKYQQPRDSCRQACLWQDQFVPFTSFYIMLKA